jgi:hypothetical protein
LLLLSVSVELEPEWQMVITGLFSYIALVLLFREFSQKVKKQKTWWTSVFSFAGVSLCFLFFDNTNKAGSRMWLLGRTVFRQKKTTVKNQVL